MTIARAKIAVAVLLFAAGGVLWALSLTGHAEEATAAAEPVELTSLVQPLEASLPTDLLKAALQGNELLGVFVLPVGECPPPLIDVDAYTHLLQDIFSGQGAGLVIALVNEDKPLAERYARILDLPLPSVTAQAMDEVVTRAREELGIGLYLQPPGGALRYVPLVPGLTPGQRQELLGHAVEGVSL